MILRPTVPTRIIAAVCSPMLVAAGYGLAMDILRAEVFGLVAVVVMVWASVRCFRVAVLLDEDRVTVRGWLWTRRLPRGAVRAVTDLPALVWQDRSGRSRWTPMTMFVTWPFAIGEPDLSNLDKVEALERALGLRRRWQG